MPTQISIQQPTNGSSSVMNALGVRSKGNEQASPSCFLANPTFRPDPSGKVASFVVRHVTSNLNKIFQSTRSDWEQNQNFVLGAVSSNPPNEPKSYVQQDDTQRYKIIGSLGKGGFGEVFLCEWSYDAGVQTSAQARPLNNHGNRTSTDQLSRLFALKKPLNEATDNTRGEEPWQHKFLETRILENCAHPGIVGFIGADKCKRTGAPLLYMEYFRGRDFREELSARREPMPYKFFKQKQILWIVVQLCFALEYLHRYNILHRDLKSANILLNPYGIVKLTDFGLAKKFDRDLARKPENKTIGTPQFIAPEVFREEPYDDKADMWSLGVFIYELSTLERPFVSESKDKNQNLSDIAQKTCLKPHPQEPLEKAHVPLEMIELINDLLDKKASRRPSAREVLRRPMVSTAARLFIEDYEQNVLKHVNGYDRNALAIFKDQYHQIMDMQNAHLSGTQYASMVMQQNRQTLSVFLAEQKQRELIQMNSAMEMHANQNSFFGKLLRLKNSIEHSKYVDPSTACAFGTTQQTSKSVGLIHKTGNMGGSVELTGEHIESKKVG